MKANVADVGYTLDLGVIIDWGCGLLHVHRVLSAVAELLVVHVNHNFTGRVSVLFEHW